MADALELRGGDNCTEMIPDSPPLVDQPARLPAEIDA